MTILDSLWAEEASVLHELPSLWYLVTVILSELMDTFRAPMCKIGKKHRERQRKTWGETDSEGEKQTEMKDRDRERKVLSKSSPRSF